MIYYIIYRISGAPLCETQEAKDVNETAADTYKYTDINTKIIVPTSNLDMDRKKMFFALKKVHLIQYLFTVLQK